MKYTGTRQRKIESTMNVNHIAGLEEHVAPAEETGGADAMDLPSACHRDAERVPTPDVIGFHERAGKRQIFAPRDDRIAHSAAHLDHHLGSAHGFLHGGWIGVRRRRRLSFDLLAFTARGRQSRNDYCQQPYAHLMLYTVEHLSPANVPSPNVA